MYYRTIPKTKVTACLSSRIGHMIGKNIELQEKFFVGGPLDLRGWSLNEAGEKTGGTSLLACGLHAYYPLGSNLNLHSFFTAGSAFDKDVFKQGNFKNALNYSCGAGLSVPLTKIMGQNISAEGNYIRNLTGDQKQGFQFG